MKKQLAIFLINFFCVKSLLLGFSLETNISYDYFRGLPDGSWNGNSGAFIAANSGMSVYNSINLQVGGSYGLYNWDGRGNVVFSNPNKVEQIGFLTAGLSSSFCKWNVGIVYDRLFTKHFGIYDLDPSIDQLRFQTGYSFCFDELGIWGTLDLTRAHQSALGIPTSFKAVGQMNLFWGHTFKNCARTNLWIGVPYRHSYMYPHERVGNVIAGFSVRAPLTSRLFIDGNASYMSARRSEGDIKNRNYGSSICIGLTYFYSGRPSSHDSPYMPIANHSNFFVDTNVNQ